MLTGVLPFTHGVLDNGHDLPAATGEAGFAGQFSNGGYRTGFIGKGHFASYNPFEPTNSPECIQNSGSYDARWQGPYMGFEHVELMVVAHALKNTPDAPLGQHYERFLQQGGNLSRLKELYLRALPPQSSAWNTWNSALPPAWHHSSWVADRAIAFLQAQAEQPFCLWASFPDPHFPFDCPEPWSRLHDPEAVDLPPHRERDFERRPWWHGKLFDPDNTGRGMVGRNIPVLTEPALRAVIANYYGMISQIDHQVGRMLIALTESGLLDNTLVIFTSDHGDWLGDHGLLLKGPIHYEGLLRVGMILRGAGIPAGKVVDDPVSTLDLAPTLLAAAGLSPARVQHGRSLLELLPEQGANRDFALNEWFLDRFRMGDVEARLRTVRTKTHKLTLEEISGSGELYDLAQDPHEMDNRFNDPGLKTIQTEMLDMIRSRPDDELSTFPPRVGVA